MNVTIKWQSRELELLERAKQLAGPNKFSSLVVQLVKQWIEKQEKIIEDNPIGLRYDHPLHSKHWIDSMNELTLNEIGDDVMLIESQETLSKLKNAAYVINKNSDIRSMQLWKIERNITR